MIDKGRETPRWALERVEQERAAYLDAKPNPANVDVWLENPDGWMAYHIFAAYIASTEGKAA